MRWDAAIEQIKKGNAVRLGEWPEGLKVYYDVDEDGIPDALPSLPIKQQQEEHERMLDCLYLHRPNGRRDKGYWPIQDDYISENWQIA